MKTITALAFALMLCGCGDTLLDIATGPIFVGIAIKDSIENAHSTPTPSPTPVQKVKPRKHK